MGDSELPSRKFTRKYRKRAVRWKDRKRRMSGGPKGPTFLAESDLIIRPTFFDSSAACVSENPVCVEADAWIMSVHGFGLRNAALWLSLDPLRAEATFRPGLKTDFTEPSRSRCCCIRRRSRRRRLEYFGRAIRMCACPASTAGA
jgi:hypothetical protein